MGALFSTQMGEHVLLSLKLAKMNQITPFKNATYEMIPDHCICSGIKRVVSKHALQNQVQLENPFWALCF